MRLPGGERNRRAVFLNIPYDGAFARLYLAYIVGLSGLGLRPRVTLGLPGGKQRLGRILGLLDSCAYSVHDLSRVQLDRSRPRTPRFNMPFELGMAVARASGRHEGWFVFEARPRRLQKSLSDLNGVDAHIHGGTVEGVLRELCNAFVASGRPGVPAMLSAYRRLRRQVPALAREAGAQGLFGARIFDDLCFAAGKLLRDELAERPADGPAPVRGARRG